MITRLKTGNFDFEYTGSNYTEKTAIENKFKQLSGEELKNQIINKVLYGDYPNGYTFVAYICDDGKAEGLNNIGARDVGKWIIDFEKHTLQLEWANGWVDTLTTAYSVNGNIEFYDVNTGKWRTTFKKFENLEEE